MRPPCRVVEVASNGNGQVDDFPDLDQFDEGYNPWWPRRGTSNNGGGITPGVDLHRFLNEQVYTLLTAEAIFTHPKHKFKKTDDKWRGDCPRHDSKSKSSFNVTASKLLWYCPGCNTGGGPLEYLFWLRTGRIHPPHEDFIDLVRELAAMAGVAYPERELTAEEREAVRKQEARRAILRTVAQHAQEVLWSPAGESARRYLETRGFTGANVRDLGLGLILNALEVYHAVRNAGHDLAVADEAGVFRPSMVDYIIFPWMDERGHPLTLYGTYKEKTPPPGKPKKMALPGEGSKGSPLYFDRARQAGHDHLVMVEGLTDAALAQVRGDPRVVSPVCNKLSFAQAKVMTRCGVRAVTICLDPDDAGREGTWSCIKTLEKEGITAYVADPLPDGLDPDDFIKRDGIDAWRTHVSQAVHAYKWAAKEIIRKHKPQTGWTDPTQDAAIAEAVAFAAERVGTKDEELGRHFWPVIVAEAAGNLQDLQARTRRQAGVQASAATGNATTAPGGGQRATAGLGVTCLKTIRMKPLKWLVPGYLPQGKLTLVAGDGGHGKTTLTLDLAAAGSTGRPAFGLSYDPPPAFDTLIVSCEDDFEDTIVPRLVAADADLERIYRVDCVRATDGKPLPFGLEYFQAIEAELKRRSNVRLIIIDPAGAYIGKSGVDDYNDSQLRALLGPLAEVAARCMVTILLVKHLTKGATAKAVHKVSGSAGYVNAVRAAFLVAPDPEDEGLKYLLPLKLNLSQKPAGLAYRLTSFSPEEQARVLARFSDLPEEDKERLSTQLFRVEWQGTVDVDPDTVLSEQAKRHRDPM